MENPGKINYSGKVMENLQKVESYGKKNFKSCQKILPKDFLNLLTRTFVTWNYNNS